MIENKFKIVEPDSPDRCQANTATGQCIYEHAPFSQYCARHSGHAGQKAEDAKNLKMYRLGKWQNRMAEFADDPKVKGLREEIGVLRIVLEEVMQMIKTPSEILLYASKISDIVTKIEKLVTSCHRIEASTGMLLDKGAAIQLAATMVEIISRYVTDETAVDNISNEIILTIAKIKSNVEED